MSIRNKKQEESMKEAIQKVVAVGPDFLHHKITAVEMAHTMINSVEECVQKTGNFVPQTREESELYEVLGELMGCGSGFLENRCDAACVARTISYMVDEFSDK